MTQHCTDLTMELADDHRAILAIFDRIHSTPLEDPARERLLRHAAGELERHAIAERRFLLPVLRRRLTEGEDMARAEAEEHERLTGMVNALGSASVARPGFDAQLRALELEVKRHIRHDEHSLFPLLRQACPHEDLHMLGSAFREHATRHHADVAA
ncbi:hemerythrin domain-containing protein [Streptomyces sp. cg36]|uniref:hemerythrin domain-containing protein n=1 Tax=Streptomyces sp. cg36 TaxID=3238798 RepID=UPI0034E1CE2A